MSNELDVLDFGDVDISDLNGSGNSSESDKFSLDEGLDDGEAEGLSGLGDQKEEPNEEKADAKSDEEEPVKSEVKEEKEASSEKPSKIISVNSKGKEIQLDPETEIKHKVDGKPVTFKLKELLNQKAGEVSYNKKFQELGDERKAFKTEKSEYLQEKAELFEKASKFAEKAKSGDPFAAVAVLAELAGQDPLETIKKFKSQVMEIAQKYSGLSEEQRKILDLDDELRYNRDLLNQRKADDEFRQTQIEIGKQVESFRQKNNLSDEELIEIYDNVRQGKPNEVVSIADLETAFTERQTQKSASEILSSISPDLSSESNVKIVSNFMRQNPGINKAILTQMIKDELGMKDVQESPKPGKSAAKVVSDKIRKNSPNKKYSYADESEDNDYASFDDVNF